jgi:CheY-like chemotaxis protein
MQQTCLIAAHDPWFIQLLRIYTEESGLRPVQAYEGQEVLPLAYKESPAVILLQADLPGEIKGLDLLCTLRQDPQMKKIPVLLFSWMNIESMDQAAAQSAVYLQEPVTYEAFQDALQKAGICAPKR